MDGELPRIDRSVRHGGDVVVTRREFELPDVGEGVTEGQLLEWFVETGETVTEDQVVAEVETDKAVVDVPAPIDGSVVERRADAGDVVPVGDVLVVFETEDDGGDAATAETADDGDTGATDDGPSAVDDATASTESTGRVFAPPSVRRLARELGVDLTTVDGSGPGGRIGEQDVRRTADAATGDARDGDPADESSRNEGRGGDGEGSTSIVGSVVDAESASAAEPTRSEPSATAASDREETLALPRTRALADERGVDIEDVPASGEYDGSPMVTADDVARFADGASTASDGTDDATATDSGTATESKTATDATSQAADGDRQVGERVPYRGIRRTIGEQMQRSKSKAPHATHHESVDVSELVSVREELGEIAEEKGFRLTFTPFFLKAVVAGLQEYPTLNSRLDEQAEEIVCYDRYDVGVAVDTPHGLVVPVVDDVDQKSIADLGRELRDLIERAQDRSLSAAEMQGGTFTVSNAGSLGGEYATPIINHPQAAILGFGAIRKRPWVVDDEVVPRHVLPLSLSFDHRVLDGATGARFVNDVREYLREPRRLLLE